MPDSDTVEPPHHTGALTGNPALASWLVTVPSLLLAVYVGGVSTIGWSVGEFNLAEAAIYGDAGEAERLIANGANPQASYSVRASVSREDHDLVLTPMEAAIKEGQTVFARLLVARGAVAGAAQAEELRCLAEKVQRAEIVELLAATYPDSGSLCQATQRPW